MRRPSALPSFAVIASSPILSAATLVIVLLNLGAFCWATPAEEAAYEVGIINVVCLSYFALELSLLLLAAVPLSSTSELPLQSPLINQTAAYPWPGLVLPAIIVAVGSLEYCGGVVLAKGGQPTLLPLSIAASCFLRPLRLLSLLEVLGSASRRWARAAFRLLPVLGLIVSFLFFFSVLGTSLCECTTRPLSCKWHQLTDTYCLLRNRIHM